VLLAACAPRDLNLIGAGSLRYIDKDGRVAFPFCEQLIALLDSSSVKITQRQVMVRRPTSFSSSSSPARSSSLEALRPRTLSGEVGVPSSSTGSALMLWAEMTSSGFAVSMGETTWSLEVAMVVAGKIRCMLGK